MNVTSIGPGISLATLCLSVVELLVFAPTASAQEAAGKPPMPDLRDILTNSGVSLTGYLDTTYTQQRNDTTGEDHSTFALQQAALTISRLPTSGLGALANVIVGQNPYTATGFGTTTQGQGSATTGFYLLQAYAQYAAGSWSLQAG